MDTFDYSEISSSSYPIDYSWWPDNVFLQYIIIGSVMSLAVIFCTTIILMIFSFGNKEEFKEIRDKAIIINIAIVIIMFITSMLMALSSAIINNLGLLWLIGILAAIFIISITILIYNIKKRM